LNQESIDFVKKLNETTYKTETGTIIITAKEITNRKVNLLPTISFFIFLKSLKI